MNIISFPIELLTLSHDKKLFEKLGFRFLTSSDNTRLNFSRGKSYEILLKDLYVLIPNNWTLVYNYQKTYEFICDIFDEYNRKRGIAFKIGQTAVLELLCRYRIENYKPLRAPNNFEYRLIDGANNRILFSCAYNPTFKLIDNQFVKSNDDNSTLSFQRVISFRNSISNAEDPDDPLAYW